jgi:steroid Delta-isomerase
MKIKDSSTLMSKTLTCTALSIFAASITIPAIASQPNRGQLSSCRSEVTNVNSSKAPTSEQVRTAVSQYFEGTRSMNAAQWASAFASNAVVEDPIGQPPLTTPQTILAQGEGFVTAFSQVGLQEMFVEVNGDEAVAYWVGRGIQKDGERVQFEGINHFRFDEDGKIVHLRGFWNPANIRPE